MLPSGSRFFAAKRVRLIEKINQGSAHETESIPLTEYCRAVLDQRRGGSGLESSRRVIAATVI